MIRTEPDQLEHKRALVERLVHRAPDCVVPSPRTLGYRARICLRTDERGRLCYSAPRSHRLVPVDACAIARPEIARVLARLPLLPGLDRVEIRTDGRRVVLVGRGRADLEVLERIEELDGVVVGRETRGETQVEIDAGGVTHHVGPQSFYQVNLEVNRRLVDAVIGEVRAREPTRLLDLCAGVGNFSLPLAVDGIPVTLIEVSAAALADARRDAEALGVEVELIRGDAGRFRAGEAFFDAVILDPPRKGAPGVVAELLLTRPRTLIYVSCNPHTLARDLWPAREAGYRLARLEIYDMFPQTHHVETLCVLDR